MSIKESVRIAAVCISLAGAAAGSSIAAAKPAAASPAGLVYVLNSGPARVEIYPGGTSNPSPIGTITDGLVSPSTLAVDAAGTLYVQNGNNTITVYPRGSKKPSKTLQASTPSGSGTYVAVGPDKTVYSTNRGDDDIYEYANGGTVLSGLLNLPSPLKPASIAISPKNDVYVGFANLNLPGNAGVYVFPGGQSPGHALAIALTYPAGLAIDPAGNLLAGDAGAQTIDIFKSGATKPFRTLHTAPCAPYQFALDASGKTLYIACGSPASVMTLDYATGAPAGTISQGLGGYGFTLGVAADPAAP